MGVRPRRLADLPVLERILEEVAADGYPPHRPPTGASRFVESDDEVASFVYELDGEVVGHVAVHQHTARPVMELAAGTLGRPLDGLAAVARLFVAPAGRRRGVGRALLDAAAASCHERRLHAVLDVWNQLSAAVALYETAGWARVGSVTIEFRSDCTPECTHDGTSIDSLVYVSGPARARAPS